MIWPNVEPRLPRGALVESAEDGQLGHVTGWEGYDDEAYVRWVHNGSVSLVPSGDLIPINDPTTTTAVPASVRG